MTACTCFLQPGFLERFFPEVTESSSKGASQYNVPPTVRLQRLHIVIKLQNSVPLQCRGTYQVESYVSHSLFESQSASPLHEPQGTLDMMH